MKSFKRKLVAAPVKGRAVMTSEELLQLPNEEFVQFMQEESRQRLAAFREITAPNYAGYTFEQKVRYWSYTIH
jgi:hypothetical protein